MFTVILSFRSFLIVKEREERKGGGERFGLNWVGLWFRHAWVA